MKHHTRVYLDYFGFKIPEDCFCEIPDCNTFAVDVNHIYARGMGGSKTKDNIENLMAMCRKHHIVYGDVPSKKEWLKEIHLKFMQK